MERGSKRTFYAVGPHVYCLLSSVLRLYSNPTRTGQVVLSMTTDGSRRGSDPVRGAVGPVQRAAWRGGKRGMFV